MALWTNGNTLKLLENGDSFFNAVLEAIYKAKSEIFFETYIYQWDNIGQKLGEAFTQAVKRGVKIHVLLDSFGSHNFPSEVVKSWQQLGIQVRFYQPLRGLQLLQKATFSRLHRKCIAIDQCVAFIGGINVGDDYLQQPNQPARLDYAVQIEGPLVPRIQKRMSWLFLRQLNDWKSYFPALAPAFSESPPANGQSRAAFVVRTNLAHRKSIEKEYLKAISSAQQSILIANAYFLPGFKLRFRLKQARKRGVRVRLLLQGLPEFWAVKLATQAMYHEFLKHGVEIYEYKPSYLHAKVAVIDNVWSTVGSCNLDPLSLNFNLEANVIIQDNQFANKLQSILETHIQNESVKIEFDSYQHRSLLTRFLQNFCLFFIRWLILPPR
ncbi:MAG: cardiolipin synthase ClsB [Pseudomonadota bacterium]